KIRNEAILPAGANVYSVGATIAALMASTHELGASATSGAGGGSVGVAGSVAIDIENIETTARLAGILTAGTGAGADVAITATSHATSDTKALPEESTGGVSGASSVGVGASVAVAIVDDTTTAELTGVLMGGRNVTLAATTSHGMTTHAKTGAAGAPGDASEGAAAAPADATSGGHAGTGVFDQITSQRSFANTTRSNNGGSSSDGGDSTPQTNTSDGGVSVAAAVAINLAKTTS